MLPSQHSLKLTRFWLIDWSTDCDWSLEVLQIIMYLQVVQFNVNKEADSTGDFLIHVIVKQGDFHVIVFRIQD